MKTLILAALAATSIAWASPAHADPDVKGFINAVTEDGIHGTEQALIDNGNWVCVQLADGMTRYAVADGLMGPNRFTELDALHFVDDATRYLCAQGAATPPKSTPGPVRPGIVV